MRRREILSKTGVALAAATTLAGCSTDETERESGDSNDGSGGSDESDQKAFTILSHESFQTEYGNVGVEGVGKNNSDETLSYVQIEVYFYDSSDTRLGSGLANINELKAGKKWQWEALYMGSDSEKVDNYEIQAEWS